MGPSKDGQSITQINVETCTVHSGWNVVLIPQKVHVDPSKDGQTAWMAETCIVPWVPLFKHQTQNVQNVIFKRTLILISEREKDCFPWTSFESSLLF